MDSNAPYQYPLDLKFDPSLGNVDFFVSRCNQEAVSWIKKWQEWPNQALLIVGSKGAGKTHLCQIWKSFSQAVEFNRHNPPPNLLEWVEASPGIIIDQADQIQDEALFFHLLNCCFQSRRPLLLAADLPPTHWPLQLPDLVSRLKAMFMVKILPPDDQLIRMLLLKQCEDQHLDISAETLEFILLRLERSYAAAREIVSQLHHLSLSTKRRVTTALARQALELI